MVGLAVPTNTETETLTMFVNEACDQVSVRGALGVKPSELYTDVSSVTDIKDYFSRPKLIYSFIVPTGRVLINVFAIDNPFIQNYLYNFPRVKGAYGYRCTLCFKVQLATNPFLAGRLRLAFQPFFNPAVTLALHNRWTSAAAISQLPGVELDYAEQTSMILKIPFIHPMNYFPAVDQTPFNFGTVGLFCLLPISRSNVSPFPAGSVYVWAEDFELIGAAGEPTTLPFQASLLNPEPLLGGEEVIEAQAGKLTATAKEEKIVPGALSKILGAGSRLVMVAGALVPTISSFAGPTSWALREISNIAASYGWSKPIDASPVHKLFSTMNTNQFNCDGADNAHSLGAFSENSVQPYVGFAGADVDEMAFPYLTSVSSMIYGGTLIPANPPSTYIYACDLCPKAMFFQPTFNRYLRPSLTAFWPTPIFALANGFAKYRGGFKFKVKFAKTKMHTGRVMLGFQPKTPIPSTTFAVPLEPLALNFKSLIWDLREGNEMEFDCPFICPVPFLDCDYSYGTFFIMVMEPLISVSSVGANAPFLIEVSALSGFEFAAPTTYDAVPAPLNLPIYAQSGDFEPYSAAMNTNLATYCIGEKMNSVKQIINRATLQEVLVGNSLQNYTMLVTLPVFSAGTIVDSMNTNYRYFFYAYGLNRGGAVYDFVPTTKDSTITAWQYGTGAIPGPFNRSVVTEHNTALHVRRPYYSDFSRTICDPVALDRAIFAGIRSPDLEARTLLYTRCADDFQFGYFIGFPPMCYPTQSSAVEAAFYTAVSGPIP